MRRGMFLRLAGLAPLAPLAAPIQKVTQAVTPRVVFVAHGFDGVTFKSSAPMRSLAQTGQVAQLVARGYDRIEMWVNGVCHWQDTLIPGKVPLGWRDLSVAGHLR